MLRLYGCLPEHTIAGVLHLLTPAPRDLPTHDLVVVRMGHHRGDRAGMQALRASLAELMKAVKIAD